MNYCIIATHILTWFANYNNLWSHDLLLYWRIYQFRNTFNLEKDEYPLDSWSYWLWFLNCCSYFIKLLLEKKYALPYRVIDALVAHFMRFMNETRVMPVIWHQSLLAFVERWAWFSDFSCLCKGWAVVFLICGCPSYTVVCIILSRYKNDILNEDKDNLRVLLQTQRHDLVSIFSTGVSIFEFHNFCGTMYSDLAISL